MYIFDKITHIHILFTVWASETTSKTHETHARTYTRTHTHIHIHAHTLQALCNDKYTLTYSKHKLKNTLAANKTDR